MRRDRRRRQAPNFGCCTLAMYEERSEAAKNQQLGVEKFEDRARERQSENESEGRGQGDEERENRERGERQTDGKNVGESRDKRRDQPLAIIARRNGDGVSPNLRSFSCVSPLFVPRWRLNESVSLLKVGRAKNIHARRTLVPFLPEARVSWVGKRFVRMLARFFFFFFLIEK